MGSVQKNSKPPDRDPRSRGQAPKEAKGQKPGHAIPPPHLIKCAECFKCKQFRSVVPGTNGRYFLRAKCGEGNWRRKGGQVTLHLHRVFSRSRHKCDGYETTSKSPGDREEFLRTLKRTLPDEPHLYEPDGAFVDKIEQVEICLKNM